MKVNEEKLYCTSTNRFLHPKSVKMILIKINNNIILCVHACSYNNTVRNVCHDNIYFGTT